MAGELSTVGAQQALNYLAGSTASGLIYTTTRSTYLSLLTAAPTDGSTLATMVEVNTAGYARQPVTWSAATSASPSQIQNSAAITFGPFTANMASAASHCALVSASTGTTGDFLMWWALDFAKTAALNESIQFAIAALAMTLT